MKLAYSMTTFQFMKKVDRNKVRRLTYPTLLALIIICWATYLTWTNKWMLYKDFWPMSLTMLFGSFVAGSTPQGGAAVAFPVFTKVLEIPAEESRTFGLMIQSVGMGMAFVMILVRRIRIMPKVIIIVTLGSFVGTFLGTYYLIMPNPYPRILFTLGAAAFGVALFISRWVLQCPPKKDLPAWSLRYWIIFFFVGILGGIFSAHTGSGVDMLTFIILTLTFGVFEKISTPTTVIIMAVNSFFGFFLHGVVSQDIGIVWDYWIVAVPVAAIGAPVGAYFTSKVSRDVLISFILFLIGLEMITTLLLIPFTGEMITVTAFVIGCCAFLFFGMLYYRQRRIATVVPTAVTD